VVSAETPLEGPAPTWRPGYTDDEPAYLETVRAMGVPGLDGPTGGDVVQGEIELRTEAEVAETLASPEVQQALDSIRVGNEQGA
jgi:hypothetical protein